MAAVNSAALETLSAGQHSRDNSSLPSSSRNQTPPPPATPRENADPQTPGSAADSYFNPLNLPRTNSIYTLSRVSFAAQLSQLTSLNLPDTTSLSSAVDAIPTAPAATTALSHAAAQIQRWIQKAVEVLGGLNADDDVEWAANGGREGLEDVDNAIAKFERLVGVYIVAIENLQKRGDISDVPKKVLKGVLDTLDEVVSAWANVGKLLKEVKRQVELALEWEELWNTVLGEIAMEISNVKELMFEMEEKRHRAREAEAAAAANDTSVAVDIQELETIVEESPANGAARKANNRFSLPVAFPGSSPLQSPGATASALEDSNLLALFARMQPLKASLDFLPMRLSSFRTRAESVLPTACGELEERYQILEESYKRLEQNAEKLRRELSEDRWVTVFRNAGRQAQKMCESVERGIAKIQEALDAGGQFVSAPALAKKISDYEAKKSNYGPAIQKIIAVIEKGVKERLTKNGEVIRIQAETNAMWSKLESQMKELDTLLEELQRHKSQQQMRDSMSSIVSNDVSNISMTESTIDTPGSSPASSVVLSSQPNGKRSFPATPDQSVNSRRSSMRSSSGSRPPLSRPSLSASASSSLSKRLSYNPALSRFSSASPSPGSRPSSSTPTPTSRPRGAPIPLDQRPRWNAPSPRTTPKTFDQQTYKPLSLSGGNPHTKSLNGGKIHTTNSKPSVYAYRNNNGNGRTGSLTYQHSSPLGRESSSSPAPAPSSASATSAYRSGARASSSLATQRPVRGLAALSPSPQRRNGQIVSQGNKPTPERLRPVSRLQTASTTPPSAIRIPSTSSAKRTSLLPKLSSSQSSNRSSLDFDGRLGCSGSVVDDEEEERRDSFGELESPGSGLASPSLPRPKLVLRPASAMATGTVNGGGGGTRTSLLPLPKIRH